MAARDIYLRIETIAGYSPVEPAVARPRPLGIPKNPR
jgi:hypothetical protein